MEIDRNGVETVIQLDKKEQFKTRLTAAIGNVWIKVDEITITHGSDHMPPCTTVAGGMRNLLFGYSTDPKLRTGEMGWNGLDPYKDRMNANVYDRVLREFESPKSD